MKTKIFLISIILFFSCTTIHNKSNLDKTKFDDLLLNLKLDGYYYNEGIREIEVTNFSNNNKNTITEKKNLKYLEVFFLYKNGLVLKLPNITSNTKYLCGKNINAENNYDDLHRIIVEMVNSHLSSDKKIRRNCDFNQKNIQFKGKMKVNDKYIKLQYYDWRRISRWNSGLFLQELNGTIMNDSTFCINYIIDYKSENNKNTNKIFKFKHLDKKPIIEDHFKFLK